MSKSDVSAVVNYFPTVNEGFQTAVASPGVTSGGTIVPLSSVSGLVDGSVFIGVVEPGLTNQQVFTGTVDVTNSRIIGVKWTRGANVAHATGTAVVDWDTGTATQMISAGLQKSFNPDGTLKAAAVSAVMSMNTVLQAVYPVGSLYINASVSTNPGTLLGFGTWVAHGTGQVNVGVDTAQTEFNTLGKTGGEKTHALTVGELAAHNHTGNTSTDGFHGHGIGTEFGSNTGLVAPGQFAQMSYSGGHRGDLIDGNGNHSHSFTTNTTGSGTGHNNLQPYVTVYMWKRTA